MHSRLSIEVSNFLVATPILLYANKRKAKATAYIVPTTSPVTVAQQRSPNTGKPSDAVTGINYT